MTRAKFLKTPHSNLFITFFIASLQQSEMVTLSLGVVGCIDGTHTKIIAPRTDIHIITGKAIVAWRWGRYATLLLDSLFYERTDAFYFVLNDFPKIWRLSFIFHWKSSYNVYSISPNKRLICSLCRVLLLKLWYWNRFLFVCRFI